MATKTLTITEDAYDKLRARKRDGESFTDTITRLVNETESDWRTGFGRYSGTEGDEFERVVNESEQDLAHEMSRRTDEVLETQGFELDEHGNIVSYPDGYGPDADERNESS